MLRVDAQAWARRHGMDDVDAATFARRYVQEYGHLTTAGMRPTFDEALRRFRGA